jgi:hypothetical protein
MTASIPSPSAADRPGAAVLDPSALFHTGLVVPDLDLAVKTFGELCGYRFTSVMTLQVAAQVGERVQRVEQRFALSIQEPRLELVEEIPGSVWVSDGANGAHHIGYWAEPERIEDSSRALVELGLPVEAHNERGPGEPLMWVYHRGLGGLRVELLSTLIRPMMQAWIAGADPAEFAGN